eukprot:scaffold53653_cov70-Phaeocystis_antarctica.AAC.2
MARPSGCSVSKAVALDGAPRHTRPARPSSAHGRGPGSSPAPASALYLARACLPMRQSSAALAKTIYTAVGGAARASSRRRVHLR